MKNVVWFLAGIVTITSCANQSDIAQYNDDGIYSVSSKKKKSADTEPVYFVDEQGTQRSSEDPSTADYGYRQATSTETGEDYAAKSNYDEYSMDEAYGRHQYANGANARIPGNRMRMSLGTRSMFGGMSHGFNPYAGGFGFYDPFYDPFLNPFGYGYNSGFYLSGRNPFAHHNPWGFGTGFGMGFGMGYGMMGYGMMGFGGGFYDPFYSGFYNPYGFGYNPYYLYCPPYQSGFYGDNNIYTGPRPAVSGGSVTSDGITGYSRPGGGIRNADGDIVNVDNIKPNIGDGASRGGIIRVRDNDGGYSPVIDRTPKAPIRGDDNNRGDIIRTPNQPVAPDNNRIRDNVRTPQTEGRQRNPLFNWSGDSPSNSGTRTPSNNRPSTSPSHRSPQNNSPSSPSGNFNSSPRPSAPSSPSGGGSRGGSGGGMRR